MAMAGWHLTRNRVLFFSGSLFIVLAISVHVFPYFPVLTLNPPALPETQATSTFTNATLTKYCISNLHQVEFAMPSENRHEAWNGTDWDHWKWSWEAEALRQCKYQRLDREEALQLLQGTWIVIAGDSQARLLFVALMELLLPSMEEVRPQLFKRHSNFEYALKSHHVLMEFVWAPYAVNLTRLAYSYREDQKTPDVLVSGAGLWHMLHSGNHTQYGSSLSKLKRALGSLLGHPSDQPVTPQMFWMNLPTLLPSLYQSELKIERLTTQKLKLYTTELLKSEVTGSRGLTTLLDIQMLSERCGPRCSQDGIHYSQAIYRAALHVMINNLLIVTKQTLVS